MAIIATKLIKGVVLMIYGYHRTSTREQHLDRGISEITRYCKEHNLNLEKVYTDQQTGKNFERARYIVLTEDVLRTGDTLIITEIDRLGRTKQDTLNELRKLKDRCIRVMVLELPTTLIDYTTIDNEMAKMMMETVNNMMIELYASMAEAEMHKKQKRQKEGYEALKARGEWDKLGRPRTLSLEKFKIEYNKVANKSIRPVDLMRKLKLTRSTYYRYKKELSLN